MGTLSHRTRRHELRRLSGEISRRTSRLALSTTLSFRKMFIRLPQWWWEVAVAVPAATIGALQAAAAAVLHLRFWMLSPGKNSRQSLSVQVVRKRVQTPQAMLGALAALAQWSLRQVVAVASVGTGLVVQEG